jgi:putative DNA primase/helicase
MVFILARRWNRPDKEKEVTTRNCSTNATTIKFAARGHWASILFKLGVPSEFLRKRHGPCPKCRGRDRFRFDDKNGDGTFYCNSCGAGDGFTLLMLYHNWKFHHTLKKVAQLLYFNYSTPINNANYKLSQLPTNATNWQAYQNIKNLWDSSLPIRTSDPAGRYILETRGIRLDSFPDALRFTPELQIKSGEFYKKYPAMIAAFTDPVCELVQVERFFLTAEGQKAPLTESSKRFMPGWKDGSMRGGSIKLYAPGNILAIGEGVETCLAFYSKFKVPVWAASNTTLMELVVIPASVRKVVILVDNDINGAGRKAADSLSTRLLKEKREVELLVPDKPGTDFADLFCKAG